jgi:cysteinyl-tRNA synthetase
MIFFVAELIQKGFAYESQGDVYFEVAKFSQYGRLGKQNLEQLMTGARDQVRSQDALANLKRNPVDFALWKSAGEQELHWQSPWGLGRPGWHLECSTMIKHVLGESIDIHTGGEDLIFPHHENEIAQSEALHGKPLSKYWMHNSFVQVSAEKMSKSLGNFSTIRDLIAAYSADTIRLLVLQTHYRNPIDFTVDSLVAAKNAVGRLTRAANLAAPSENGSDSKKVAADVDTDPAIKQLREEFAQAMNNDFNTAQALATLFAFADKTQNAEKEIQPIYALELKKYADLLGLKLEDSRKVLDTSTAAAVVDLLLELRQNAREKKDFATSDLIRKQLAALNINVMDAAGGKAGWERA